MANMQTFRVTKFAGLNKAVNPHNVKDNEMVAMENLFVTKSGTLESRMGYTKLGDVTSNVHGLWTTAWTAADERLYYTAGFGFNKLVDGVATPISTYWGTHPINALRYKNKMLVLDATGGYLHWYGSAESLELARYPVFTRAVPHSGWVTDIADHDSITGSMPIGQTYQYSISVRLTNNSGETANASPSTSYWATEYGGPYIHVQGDYVNGAADTGTQILKGTAVKFSCQDMHGFEVSSVRLWAREADAVPPGIDGSELSIATGSWQMLDEVTVIRLGDTYLQQDSSRGVVTAITGDHSSTTDLCNLYVTWEHVNPDKYVDEVPYESAEVANPKAKFMARLHNRIILANIVSDSAQDCKKVYLSYRGLINVDGTVLQEIQGYTYPDPMLIFPTFNHFYCDAEDIEDPITAVHAYGNNVMIFTKRCTFVWREGMGEPIKVSNEIGCIANNSIAEFEGRLVWLARGGVYAYDGAKVENLTWQKVHSYIDNMRNDYATYAQGAVYGRKYFLTAPFESSQNDLVLVYDFDLKLWHVRRYKDHSGSALYIDKLYVDYDGNDETLYFAGHSATYNDACIGTLEYGYADHDQSITCLFKMKYMDFGAPDIYKTYRMWYMNVESYTGDISTSVYIDNLNDPKATVTHRNNVDGFVINSATDGVVNSDYIRNLSDEIIATSLSRGLKGSRIQFGATMTALAAPLRIHMVGFGWLPTVGLKRKYGA